MAEAKKKCSQTRKSGKGGVWSRTRVPCPRYSVVEREGQPYCRVHDPVASQEAANARHKVFMEGIHRSARANMWAGAVERFVAHEIDSVDLLEEIQRIQAEYLKAVGQ